MTTYTKETALYDTGKIAGDIQEAGEQASSYFTDISSGGVFVHEQNPNNPQPDSSTSNGVKITNKIDIIRSGDSVAEFGETARIGKDADGYSRVLIDPYFHDGVTDIFSIEASKPGLDYSIKAHELVFDENVTGPEWRSIPLNNIYDLGSIGSESDSLNQVANPKNNYQSYKKNLGNKTFTLSELSNVSDNQQFRVLLRCIFGYKIGNTIEYFEGLSDWGQFTKGVTPDSRAWVVTQGTLNPLKKTFAYGDSLIYYTPSNNSFSYNIGFVLGTNGTSAVCWVESVQVYGLEVLEADMLRPIHRLNGNVEIDGDVDIDGKFLSDIIVKGQVHGKLETPTDFNIGGVITGQLVGATVRRMGNLISLQLSVKKTTATASGGNIFEGLIMYNFYHPIMIATSGTYYGSYSINGTISTDGNIVIRNSDSRQLAAMSTSINIQFMYFIEGLYIA